jgi:hypothetical protein
MQKFKKVLIICGIAASIIAYGSLAVSIIAYTGKFIRYLDTL